MTDWSKYKWCRICGAYEKEPCVSVSLETTKGKPVYLDEPHQGRKEL